MLKSLRSPRKLGQCLAALGLLCVGMHGQLEAQTNKAPALKTLTAGSTASLSVSNTISTIAGTIGASGFSGDGGPARAAKISNPYSIALDDVGNLYISEERNFRIRKVDNTTGTIQTIAGNGSVQFAGDGGAATAASFALPSGVAVAKNGDVYIADRNNNRIRKITVASGIINTYAGIGPSTGTSGGGYGGDNGLATAARLFSPTDVALDKQGNLYVADVANNRIRKVNAATGIITTVAGTGQVGFSGDGGPATSAKLSQPLGIALDEDGNLYIADRNNNRIRKVEAGTGIIRTIAGNGTNTYTGDGAPATAAGLVAPYDITPDLWGNLYISDNHTIRKVDKQGNISIVAGLKSLAGFVGDGGYAQNALLNHPVTVAVTPAGDLLVADYFNHAVRKVAFVHTVILKEKSANGTEVATVVGKDPENGALTYSITAGNTNSMFAINTSTGMIRVAKGGELVHAQHKRFNLSIGISDGTSTTVVPLHIEVEGSHAPIFKGFSAGTEAWLSTTDVISTIAGTGQAMGFSGDGSPATSAKLAFPSGMAMDAAGNLYFSDEYNNRIRRIDALSGRISTLAGNGSTSFNGDGLPGSQASVSRPKGLVFDKRGNLYVADHNNRIRKLDADGNIITIAGNTLSPVLGDGESALATKIQSPADVLLDAAGNLYIADRQSFRIRKVDISTGIATTVAGTGVSGSTGDGGPGTAAKIYYPNNIAFDAAGNLLIAEDTGYKIRKLDKNGMISTVAGTGQSGTAGDGGLATAAQFTSTANISADANGNFYVSDNTRLRKVDKNGMVQTVAGVASAGYSGDGGPAAQAKFNGISHSLVSPAGDIYISDKNHVIRKITYVHTATLPEGSANGTVVATLAASDPEGKALSYSITGGNTEGAFAVNAANGTITVAKSSALDYETTQTFTLSLGVSNGSATTIVKLTIKLIDLAMPAVSTTAATAIQGRSATLGGNVTAADGGAVSARGIEWGTASGVYPNKVVMGSGTGTFSQLVNGLQPGTKYYYRAFATNPEGTARGAEMSFTTPNAALDIKPQTFRIDENAPVGTAVGTMVATAAPGQILTYNIQAGNGDGIFAIDAATGAITVASNSKLDFETQQDFWILIMVTDGQADAGANAHIILNNLSDVAPAAKNVIADLVVQEDAAFSHSLGADAFEDSEAETLAYSATLADGAPLPDWLSFTPATRTFAGTPQQAQVGEVSIKVMVTDPGNNSAAQTFKLTVENVNDAPVALALSNHQREAEVTAGALAGTLSAEDEDPNDTHTYSLIAGSGDSDNTLFQIQENQLLTNAALPVAGRTTYQVRIVVHDAQGAGFEKSFTIELQQPQPGQQSVAFLPNLFSPNGDGNNDRFILRATDVANARLRIYNRMGQLVYESSNVQQLTSQGWDGTHSGKPQPEGAYIWQLEGILTNKTPLRIEGKSLGTIVLIR